MKNITLNMAMIGKSGVGKSALINYIFNQDICKSGIGKPVTEQGFHKFDTTINGVSLSIYDSWGLEADKYNIWLDDFSKFCEAHGRSSDISEWLHVAYYCIDAAGARFEEADKEIIERLAAEKIKVNIILTKAALISEEQTEQLKSAIESELTLNYDYRIIPVNSVQARLRSGTLETYGIEEIYDTFQIDYIDLMVPRMVEHVKYLLINKVEEYTNRIEYKSLFQKKAAKNLYNTFWETDYNTILDEECARLRKLGIAMDNLKFIEEMDVPKKSAKDIQDKNANKLSLIKLANHIWQTVFDSIDAAEDFNTTMKSLITGESLEAQEIHEHIEKSIEIEIRGVMASQQARRQKNANK